MMKPRCHIARFFPATCVLLAALALHSQQPPDAPATSAAQLSDVPGRLVTITPEAGFNNEPSVAVNPATSSQVIAAYQMPARVAYSQDGGSSWKLASGTTPTDYRISGDVSVTYDKHGTAILCYIA